MGGYPNTIEAGGVGACRPTINGSDGFRVPVQEMTLAREFVFLGK